MKMTVKTKRKYQGNKKLIKDTKYELLGIIQNYHTNSKISFIIVFDGLTTCLDSGFFRLNSIKMK